MKHLYFWIIKWINKKFLFKAVGDAIDFVVKAFLGLID
jgi:hypothetical protein